MHVSAVEWIAIRKQKPYVCGTAATNLLSLMVSPIVEENAMKALPGLIPVKKANARTYW